MRRLARPKAPWARCFADDPRAAVVKIFNTRQRPGWTVPWQARWGRRATGR